MAIEGSAGVGLRSSQHRIKNRTSAEDLKKSNGPGKLGSASTRDASITRGSARAAESSGKKKRGDSADKTCRRPASGDPDKSPRRKFPTDDREHLKTCPSGKDVPSKSTADRKSLKSYASIASTISGKKSDRNNFKSDGEEAEASHLLQLTLQKHNEILQTFQQERGEFRKRVLETEGKTEKAPEGRIRKPVADGNRPLELRRKCAFNEAYGNHLEEILHIWLNLLYCILNLRVNLVKVIQKSGKDTLAPNIKFEREILMRAIESVKFISMLKMKYLGETLEIYRLNNTPKKTDQEILAAEAEVASSFVREADFVASCVKDVIGRVTKGKTAKN